MKLLLIANPQAGHGRAKASVEALMPTFQSAGVSVDLVWTQAPEQATTLVRETDLAPYDGVAAAGGDGTLFEVLNGLMENPQDERPPFGLLPLGTGNAFCRDLDLGSQPVDEALRRICAGQTRAVDIGRFTWGGQTNWFANILGLGFVTDASVTAHKLKLFGNLSYSLAVLIETITLNACPMTIEIDGQRFEREGTFLEIANSRYTSNFLIAPDAAIDDGVFDIILANRLSRIQLLRAFPKVFVGDHVKLPQVEVWQGRNITITTPETKILAPDGEILGETPVEVECLPGELTLLA